jgi:hypothetical protein
MTGPRATHLTSTLPATLNWSNAMHPTLHPTTYLDLSRADLRERQLEAEAHVRAVRLLRLRRRERQAERATTRARLARLAVG